MDRLDAAALVTRVLDGQGVEIASRVHRTGDRLSDLRFLPDGTLVEGAGHDPRRGPLSNCVVVSRITR